MPDIEIEKRRRRFPRVAKLFRVNVLLLDPRRPRNLSARSRDVSVGGVSVHVSEELPKGAALRVTFSGLQPGEDLTVEGRVAWCAFDAKRGAHEAGIEITGLDTERLEKLLMLIGRPNWQRSRARDTAHFLLKEDLLVERRRTGSQSEKDWLRTSSRRMSIREIVIFSPEPVGRGTNLELRVHLPDTAPPTFCRGAVCEIAAGRRSNHWNVNVAIDRISDEDRLRLAAFLSGELIGEPGDARA